MDTLLFGAGGRFGGTEAQEIRQTGVLKNYPDLRRDAA